MQTLFSHFLITRFNLRMKHWLKTDEDVSAWMDHRTQIFLKFTWPSVCAQTTKNFKWLILFDPATKEDPAYSAFIEKITEPAFIYPVFIDLNEVTLVEGLKQEIDKHISPDTKHIITSRIDNDDAIHEDYIKRVQEHFIPNKNYILNFTDGLGYSDNLLSIAKRNKVNPFATYFETTDNRDLQTVYCTGHPSLKKVAPVNHVSHKLMYLVNFHDNNVSNRHVITTQIGLIWHYFVRYLCFAIPQMNRHIRYSFSRPTKDTKIDLEKFNLQIS